MKNQYFGDIRDLFKYDLIHHLINTIDTIGRFTFIPMLTPNDNRPDGNKTNHVGAKAGNKNVALCGFLSDCIRNGKRNICEIKRYFKDQGVPVAVYGEGGVLFNSNNRAAYFKSISDELLKQSLVFLDPDNGLEISDSSDRHVLFKEIISILDRMDDKSVLMVIQFFPRENHQRYLERRTQKLVNIMLP